MAADILFIFFILSIASTLNKYIFSHFYPHLLWSSDALTIYAMPYANDLPITTDIESYTKSKKA